MSDQISPKIASREPFLLPLRPETVVVPPLRRSSAVRQPPAQTGAGAVASSSSCSLSVSAPSARRPRPDLDPEDDPPTLADDQTPTDTNGTTAAPKQEPVDPDIPISGKQGKRWREDDDEAENCCICLQQCVDRTVMVGCGHDNFCFSCLCVWTDQSRKCPLCSHPIGPYLLHNLWTPPPFLKFFLPPLASKPSQVHPQNPHLPPPSTNRAHAPRPSRPTRTGEALDSAVEEAEDAFERTVERRRELYRWGLLAKHVASNNVTRYKPVPSPQAFAANADMISKATIWMRREFRVWSGVDVEFMLTYTLSLMASVDIRSEPAVRLLAEFLDIGRENERKNAEQFVHELYSFLRSPFRDLALYDAAAQYDPTPQAATLRRQEEQRNLSPRFRHSNPHHSQPSSRYPDPRRRPSPPPLSRPRYPDRRERSPSPKRARRARDVDEEDRRRDAEREDRRRLDSRRSGRPVVPALSAVALALAGDDDAGLGEALGRSASGTLMDDPEEDDDDKDDEGEVGVGRGRSRSRSRSIPVDRSRSRSPSRERRTSRSPSMDALSDRSRSRSDSRGRSRSWSRSLSRSRSRSPDGDRQRLGQRDRYLSRHSRSPSPRRWNVADKWLAPEVFDERERAQELKVLRRAHRVDTQNGRFPHSRQEPYPTARNMASSKYNGPREMRPLGERRTPKGYGADVRFAQEQQERDKVELMDLCVDTAVNGDEDAQKREAEAKKKLGLGMRANWDDEQTTQKVEGQINPNFNIAAAIAAADASGETNTPNLLRRISGINGKPIPTGPKATGSLAGRIAGAAGGASLSIRGRGAARGRGAMSIRGAAGGGRLAQMSIKGAADGRRAEEGGQDASVVQAPLSTAEPKTVPLSAAKTNPSRNLLLRRLEEAKADAASRSAAAPAPVIPAANGTAPVTSATVSPAGPVLAEAVPAVQRRKIDVGMIQKRLAEEKRRAVDAAATSASAGSGTINKADDEAALRRKLLAKLGR